MATTIRAAYIEFLGREITKGESPAAIWDMAESPRTVGFVAAIAKTDESNVRVWLEELIEGGTCANRRSMFVRDVSREAAWRRNT